MIKNLNIMQKVGSIITSFVLAGTLIGCTAKNKEESTDANIASSELVIENINSSSMELIDSANSSSDASFVEKHIEESDSAVEAALGIMIEGTEKLSEASEQAKSTEEYKEAKEQALENFDDLYGFLFNEEEIAGYTREEVQESTIQYAEETLYDLDNYIEGYFPEYKDKLKEKMKKAEAWLEEKGTDLAASGYNKIQELKEKTLEKAKNK